MIFSAIESAGDRITSPKSTAIVVITEPFLSVERMMRNCCTKYNAPVNMTLLSVRKFRDFVLRRRGTINITEPASEGIAKIIIWEYEYA